MREKRNTRRVLVGKPLGKIIFSSQRKRHEDNIKMGLMEIGFGNQEVNRAGSGLILISGIYMRCVQPMDSVTSQLK
jgi:hypothetical protein